MSLITISPVVLLNVFPHTIIDRFVAALWLRLKCKSLSIILGVGATPRARETLQKCGGRSPPPFWRVSTQSPRAAQTPKTIDFLPL